ENDLILGIRNPIFFGFHRWDGAELRAVALLNNNLGRRAGLNHRLDLYVIRVERLTLFRLGVRSVEPHSRERKSQRQYCRRHTNCRSSLLISKRVSIRAIITP